MKNTLFDTDPAEKGKLIETKNARNGGYLVGRSHKNGGIKGVNVDTGEPIEVEGGEVVITKPAVESSKTYLLNGKEMKPKEILSKLNSDHGGVAFAKGGQVNSKKFLLGGVNNSLYDKFLQQRFNPNIVLKTMNDDLDSTILKALSISYDNYDNLVVQFEASNDEIFINCITYGDIFYLKKLRGELKIRLEGKNQEVDFSRSEIPFILKGILSNAGKVVDTLILERTYTNSDGDLREETLIWDKREYSYYQDDIIAVPKIYSNEITNFFIAEGVNNYDEVVANSQDFLNGKYVINKDLQLCIGGYGLGTDTNNDLKFISKNYGAGYNFEGTRSIQNNDESIIAVGDVWQIEFIPNFVVQKVELQQEGLDFQLLKQDGVYVINYESQQEAELSAVLFTNSDPKINLSQVFFIEGDYDFGGATVSVSDPLEELTVKIIGFILTKYKTYEIQPFCEYFLVEDVNTGEKLIIYQPQFKNCVSLATANDYNQASVVLSDADKKLRQTKKKDIRDTELYQLLLESLDQEEVKLIVMKSLVSSTNVTKTLNIDRRLTEIALLKAQYKLDSQTALNLLDQFEQVYYTSKSSSESSTLATSINGQPSQLTPTQYERVNSPEFMDWFGDWKTAYELDDYTGISKVINPTTAEPYVLYHGTDADFTAWKFNQFPAAYFGDNKSYSEWFANLKSQGGEGHMYECFIQIKNPIDMRQYGLDNQKMGDILMYLEQTYNLKPSDIVPQLANLPPEQFQQVMDVNLKAWQFVRRGEPFLRYIKDKTFYDGILMFEDNPQDVINGEVNTTGSYVVFREGQIKWAGASFFNSVISDNRFAKGGRIKSLRNKYKDLDFVF